MIIDEFFLYMDLKKGQSNDQNRTRSRSVDSILKNPEMNNQQKSTPKTSTSNNSDAKTKSGVLKKSKNTRFDEPINDTSSQAKQVEFDESSASIQLSSLKSALKTAQNSSILSSSPPVENMPIKSIIGLRF